MRFCCLPYGGAEIPCQLDAQPHANCASRRPCPHTLLFAREQEKHIGSLYSNQYSENKTLDGPLRVEKRVFRAQPLNSCDPRRQQL
jgi:hypothetical protein